MEPKENPPVVRQRGNPHLFSLVQLLAHEFTKRVGIECISEWGLGVEVIDSTEPKRPLTA